jgi:hypothetical protein
LRQVLYTGGHIFITVPDASRYTQGEDAPFQEFSAEHINFFGESSLTNLLHNNGFQTVSIQHDMIESNYRTTTPVIHGLFKKLETVESLTVFIDIETRTDLVDYIKKSNRTDAKIQATIDNIVNKEIQIIVWGTGAHTLRLLKTSRLGQASIRVFVDSNPRYQGKQLHNSPIISPEELKVFSDPILISSRQYQEEIVSQIRGPMGMQNELIRLYRL